MRAHGSRPRMKSGDASSPTRESELSDDVNPQAVLSEFAIALDWASVPTDVRLASTTFLLDTLSTILAGSSAPGVAAVIEQLKEWGGAPQASVAVFGGALPAPSAAMANAAMAHA